MAVPSTSQTQHGTVFTCQAKNVSGGGMGTLAVKPLIGKRCIVEADKCPAGQYIDETVATDP